MSLFDARDDDEKLVLVLLLKQSSEAGGGMEHGRLSQARTE